MKAMKNVSRGKGFRGCLDYVFLRDEKARRAGKKPGILIGGNMSGHDPRTLAAEFGITRKVLTKRKIEKPVWHQTLRLPAGEKLTTEKWIEIADEYMSLMGFTGLHMRSYVLHDDEDGQHIHIVASRVGLDGDVYKGQNDNYRSTNIVRGLEKKHGLRVTSEEKRDKAQPSKNELEKALRTGKQPPKMVIQDTIDQIMACGSLGTSDFVSILGEYEITAKANIASTGKLSGFSFSLASHTDKSGQPIFFKGSTLGKAFTAAGLVSRGLQYNPIRDMPILTGRHPQPAPDYSGDPKVRKKNGGREFSLIVFMRFEPSPGGQLYRWQSGAPAFIDRGNEIICVGKATGAKIRGMLDLAREKGWSRIELYGPREFQMAAAREAAIRGISVSSDNKEIQEIWRQEYDRTADARNGLGIDEQNAGDSDLRREDVIDGIETRPSSAITTTPEASDTARNRASETGYPGTPARFDGDKKGHREPKYSGQDVCSPAAGGDFQNDRSWLTDNEKGNREGLAKNGKKDSERDTRYDPRGLATLDQTHHQPASPDSRSDAEERSLQQIEPKSPLNHYPSPGG
ncbi:MAG: relaxase/mobilization nuclease domain-containing protein [Proteobacteria bacterium]|nr:relaxase/mobilization nuclease domain-containing protein [Pseudomonadota bacterium]